MAPAVVDYETSWRNWAAKQYPEPWIAQIAAAAGFAATRAGATPEAANVTAHRAAVRAGGEYRCRQDRAGMAIAVCVVLFGMFVPATLVGLSVNAGIGGYLFLAGSIVLPVLAVTGLNMVRRNSCFFVTRDFVGRRDWLGHVVVNLPRESVLEVGVRRGSWGNTIFDDEPDESTMSIKTNAGVKPLTSLYWWSNARAAEFAAVAPP